MTDEAQRPDLADLADRLANMRILLEMKEDEVAEIRRSYEGLEHDLFDALENAQLTQIRTDRGLFSLNDLAWASITDIEKARAWADAVMPELLTLNLQRLSKVVRDALKEGRELPEGVDFKTSRKITWRRQ